MRGQPGASFLGRIRRPPRKSFVTCSNRPGSRFTTSRTFGSTTRERSNTGAPATSDRSATSAPSLGTPSTAPGIVSGRVGGIFRHRLAAALSNRVRAVRAIAALRRAAVPRRIDRAVTTCCDVLVVGGGPGGSACARALARAGVDVLVMDRAGFPRDRISAGLITLPVVDALDLNPQEYASRGLTIQPIRGFQHRRSRRRHGRYRLRPHRQLRHPALRNSIITCSNAPAPDF